MRWLPDGPGVGVGPGVTVGVANIPALRVVAKGGSLPTYTLIGALPVGPGRLPLVSNDAHWLSAALPRAMLTPWISSFTVTSPSLPQSPGQAARLTRLTKAALITTPITTIALRILRPHQLTASRPTGLTLPPFI